HRAWDHDRQRTIPQLLYRSSRQFLCPLLEYGFRKDAYRALKSSRAASSPCVRVEMDSPFGEDRLALLFVQRSGGSRLAHLKTQLVESSRAKNHQGPSSHLAGVAKLVGH